LPRYLGRNPQTKEAALAFLEEFRSSHLVGVPRIVPSGAERDDRLDTKLV
jgi:hypothetical protein